jgi:ATP-dependent helicase HrpB
VLPVDAHLGRILAALSEVGSAVLSAPPGTGKSTRVPPAIWRQDAHDSRKVVVVQPRRVAARALARRVADECDTTVGSAVGYSVRFDRRVSSETRVEFVTDGLLLRRLIADPELSDTRCVVLDEFHQRSVAMDALLALLQEARSALRDDLQLLVMSATLDPAPLAQFLGGAPIIEVASPLHAVEVEFERRADSRSLELRAAAAVRQLIEGRGFQRSILVFLPGVREIEACAQHLSGLGVPVLPLHGRLSAVAQDRALAEASGPRVILATNIAETSLTVPDVCAVIDGGMARVPRFEARFGVDQLLDQPIPRAAAEQRAGRAGRLAPGLCIRLWTAGTHHQRPAYAVPEILRSDLAEVFLAVRAWGAEPAHLNWFEAPDPVAAHAAEELLQGLGAVGPRGLTERGRELDRLPLHPRLGAMMLYGMARGAGISAATVATALDDGRPISEGPRAWPDAIRRDPAAEKRRVGLLQRCRIKLGPARLDLDEEGVAQLIAAGYPDRLGICKNDRPLRYQLANGARVRRRGEALDAPQLLLAYSLRADHKGEAWIAGDLPVKAEWFEQSMADCWRFDPDRLRAVFERVTRLGALVVDRRPAQEPADRSGAVALLLDAARRRPDQALQLDSAAQNYCARVAWLKGHRSDLELPDLADPTPLLEVLCTECNSFQQMRSTPMLPLLKQRLTHLQRRAVEQMAPLEYPLPGGRPVKLEYRPDGAPVMAAKLQRFLGITETPRVAGGRVPVVLHLLAPNGRPAQITDDLAGFWRGSYSAVRKELRGRYPKHRWPKDPLA